MSRPLRVELADGLYHVTSRGDRRENIDDIIELGIYSKGGTKQYLLKKMLIY